MLGIGAVAGIALQLQATGKELVNMACWHGINVRQLNWGVCRSRPGETLVNLVPFPAYQGGILVKLVSFPVYQIHA